MPSTDLSALAAFIAAENDASGLVPVIEKELLHYEILSIMEDGGFLNELTFQGGTCLRLCYGASRYSEDLDFAGGAGFDFSDMSELRDALERSLRKRYDTEVAVSERPQQADDSGVSVKRWQVKVTTAPARRDIPLQRISIEVASVDAHTREVRPLDVNYEQLPISYADILMVCESLEEICADKLKAFLTSSYLRYRDLWDLRWIARRPGFDRSQLSGLFAQKLADYHQQETAEQNAGRIADIPAIVKSSAFLQQMKRFLPSALQKRTIARPVFLDDIAREVGELYGLVRG